MDTCFLDDDDDWNEDFIRQADELTRTALASRAQPTPLPLTHSPPRQLTQRPPDPPPPPPQVSLTVDNVVPNHTTTVDLAKEQEIDALKKELGRVSKELNQLEQECSVLRKERDQQEKELKLVNAKGAVKVAEEHGAKTKDTNHLVSSSKDPGTSRDCQNANSLRDHFSTGTKSCNSVGVQTEKTAELSCRGSEKLLGLWNSSEKQERKDLLGKLLTTCGADINVLFGFMSSSQSNSDNVFLDQQHPNRLTEAAKVSVLYSEWMKISNEASRLEYLLEALVDLCSLRNVVIVHRSLCVLRTILMNSFGFGKNFGKSRENVTVDEAPFGNNNSEINGCGYSENETQFIANMTQMFNQSNIPHGLGLLNVRVPCPGGFLNHDSFADSVSGACWVSLFERICQTANTNNDEKIRYEALSIMNLILVRQNAYMERDKFAGDPLFQTLAQLLRRDAGFCVQDLAVRALSLLCNCPKVVAMLCSGIREDIEHASSSDTKENRTLQSLNRILIGLADCVACSGTATAEEMKLRRNAILFLAFLGSSGQAGFEIVLNYKLPKGNSFLTSVVHSLVSDLELGKIKSAQLSDIAREHILLIREALILLNRLASHQKYSSPVLQSLTNTREMASMTVDLANRLTCKSKLSWQDNQTSKKTLETEVLDLARVFKKRVFTYLGDSIS